MANLIIKSSADNLVLQGSDASPAITVGATGTTTFAENATLSGTGNQITSLGSVTTGAMGSGVTLPAGHVVQLATVTSGTTESSGTSQNAFLDTPVVGSITPRYSDSNILIMASYTCYLYNTSSDGGYAVRWKKTVGGVDSNPTGLFPGDTGSTANTHYQMYASTANTTEHVDGRTLQLIEMDVDTTSPVTYTLQWASYNATNVQIGGTYGAKWFVHIFEIKG